MVAREVETFNHVIITPRAASALVDMLGEIVEEANANFPRGKQYSVISCLRDDSSLTSSIYVSDGTDRYIVAITLDIVSAIIKDKNECEL